MTVEIIIFSVIGFFVLLFIIGWWFSIKIMREQWAERSRIRKSDDYKNKNYFQFYWGEQKRLFKKAFSPEYKTETFMGLGLTFLYLFYFIYAVICLS